MYCESCGTFIPDGQAYCTNCGAQAPIILAEPVQLPGSQPVKQPVNQPVNQPVSQPVGQPAYQSVEVDRYGTRNVSVEVPVQSVTNYMARAGLICGIVAMITTYIPYTNIIPAVLGVIFSLKGLKQTEERGGKPNCIIGLALSCFAATLWTFSIILGLYRLATGNYG